MGLALYVPVIYNFNNQCFGRNTETSQSLLVLTHHSGKFARAEMYNVKQSLTWLCFTCRE